MPDIHQQFPIDGVVSEVFRAVSTGEGLSAWWTLNAEGEPIEGSVYSLAFGPGYDWKGRVLHAVRDREIEWEIFDAEDDWNGSRVGLRLEDRGERTLVHFHHKGWPEDNDHYRTSGYCWAMYLRLLKRYVERGEVVAYPERLDA